MQIDLGQIVRITGIATQGHYDIMSLDEYTPSYDLKYKTSFYGPWNSYTSFSRAYGGTQVRQKIFIKQDESNCKF